MLSVFLEWIKFPGMPNDIGSVEWFKRLQTRLKTRAQVSWSTRTVLTPRKVKIQTMTSMTIVKVKAQENATANTDMGEDEPEFDYEYKHDCGQSSLYTYLDVDCESASSPSTSSHPKKATETSREQERPKELSWRETAILILPVQKNLNEKLRGKNSRPSKHS